MTDHSAATFIWQTDPPSKELIAIVREEISKSLVDLDEPGELIFHHVRLDKEKGFDGPAVILTGNKELNGFDASYHPEGFKQMTFKLDEFPDIEDAMQEAIKRMGIEDKED